LEGKWSEQKIKKAIGIISELIERYEPNVLAIKKLHPARRMENLLRLANKIKEFVKRKGLKVCQYSIKEIEKSLIKGKELNKSNLFEVLAIHYPALYSDLKNERICKNPYNFRTLEAVALCAASI
jgi:Holliday junction resolvasome RuvABC endonuclease subunit